MRGLMFSIPLLALAACEPAGSGADPSSADAGDPNQVEANAGGAPDIRAEIGGTRVEVGEGRIAVNGVEIRPDAAEIRIGADGVDIRLNDRSDREVKANMRTGREPAIAVTDNRH